MAILVGYCLLLEYYLEQDPMLEISSNSLLLAPGLLIFNTLKNQRYLMEMQQDPEIKWPHYLHPDSILAIRILLPRNSKNAIGMVLVCNAAIRITYFALKI